MSVIWLKKDELLKVIVCRLTEADVVLDIGCGIQPQRYLRPLVHVCCEPHEQYISLLQGKVEREYDRRYVVLRATWAEAIRIFPPKSVDTVFLVDVIEHLKKEEGRRLLMATEELARRQVAVFTPLGDLPQCHPDGKDAWGLDGGKWQEHKSAWTPEDFDETWDVYAAEVFHTADNMGRPFESPFGAFWAIKTHREGIVCPTGMVRPRRQRIHIALDNAIDRVIALLGRWH